MLVFNWHQVHSGIAPFLVFLLVQSVATIVPLTVLGCPVLVHSAVSSRQSDFLFSTLSDTSLNHVSIRHGYPEPSSFWTRTWFNQYSNTLRWHGSSLSILINDQERTTDICSYYIMQPNMKDLRFLPRSRSLMRASAFKSSFQILRSEAVSLH